MNNAVFVSLNDTFDELTPAAQQNPLSDALRNCTTSSWRVSVGAAQDVEWIVGVVRTQIVSVYRVPVPSTMWPVVPNGALGAGRRIIPTAAADVAWFAQAKAFGRVQLAGPVGYGEIAIGPNGQLVAVRLP
ncbi:hypothetical protein WMF45_46455 [Sorangium sp. So ce448]|uniref:hypothetical protein n=1 Tax=Sorangium sp. So ce448 TaxID=3133314 RepID=UPI003F616D9B